MKLMVNHIRAIVNELFLKILQHLHTEIENIHILGIPELLAVLKLLRQLLQGVRLGAIDLVAVEHGLIWN